MAEPPRARAYVVFHAPAEGIAPASYETEITALHRSLAAEPPEGFLASAAYRVARAPWRPAPFGAVVYEDWYVVRDLAALGALELGAVRDPHRSPHDALARSSGPSVAALYNLRVGEVELGTPRFESWSEKPRGVLASDHLRNVYGTAEGPEAVWQRTLGLGPSPEFCRRTAARPAEGPASVVEIRPVVVTRAPP